MPYCTHTVRYNDRTLSQWLFVMMQSALKNQTIRNNYPIKMATKKKHECYKFVHQFVQNALFAFEWGFQNCNFHHPKTKTRTGLFFTLDQINSLYHSIPFNWKKMRPLHVFRNDSNKLMCAMVWRSTQRDDSLSEGASLLVKAVFLNSWHNER